MLSLKRTIHTLALIALMGLATTTYASKKHYKAIKPNQHNESKPILVTAKSPTFTIKLPSNPSTGYSWFLKSYDHKLLKPKSYQYNPSSNNAAGAPGISEWTFEADDDDAFSVPQVTKIVFQYMRPWEAKPVKTKKITVLFFI